MSPEALPKATYRQEVAMKFVPDPTGIISAEVAQRWGTEVTRIYHEHGTTGRIDGDRACEVVLREATDPASPLHQDLQWDDKVAGHQHRLNQCRYYIRHVYVQVLPVGTSEPILVHAFVNVVQTHSGERSYKPVQMIDGQEQDQLVQQAKAELSRWKARYELYRHIDDIACLVAGVRDLLDTKATHSGCGSSQNG